MKRSPNPKKNFNFPSTLHAEWIQYSINRFTQGPAVTIPKNEKHSEVGTLVVDFLWSSKKQDMVLYMYPFYLKRILLTCEKWNSNIFHSWLISTYLCMWICEYICSRASSFCKYEHKKRKLKKKLIPSIFITDFFFWPSKAFHFRISLCSELKFYKKM